MATTLVIHAGHLSVDNGARYPLSYYFDLARLLGVPAETGNYYGDDRLTVQSQDLETVEELLRENKMLYKVEGRDRDWTNVQTDVVARRVSRRLH